MQTVLHYLPIISIAILISVAVAILAIRSLRPNFGFSWLIAAIVAIVTWLMFLLSRLDVPHSTIIATWRMDTLYIGAPTLVLDEISWPFTLTLATLLLAVILSDVARPSEQDWWDGAGCMFMTAIGIFSVMAGDPITLLWSWVAMDVYELLLLIKLSGKTGIQQNVVGMISFRIGGIILYLLGGGSGETQILAASTRLGSLFYNDNLQIKRGFGTLARLVAPASSLVLIAHVAVVGVSESTLGIFLPIVVFLSVVTGLSWANAKTEKEGFPYWVSGITCLAIASALSVQPYASLAWGIVMLLSGGVVFLYSTRLRYMILLPILGVITLSGAPFSPAWDIGLLYNGPFTVYNILFLIAHSTFLFGYIRHALRSGENPTGVERGVALVYFWGLLLLPLTHLLIGLWSKPQISQDSTLLFPIEPKYGLTYWSGVLAVILALVWIGIWRMHIRLPEWLVRIRIVRISFSGLTSMVSAMYRLMNGIVNFFSIVIEGEGGLLWTLLFLVLILAFFIQG